MSQVDLHLSGPPLTLEQVDAWRRRASATGRAVCDVVARHLEAVSGVVDWGDYIEIQFAEGDRVEVRLASIDEA